MNGTFRRGAAAAAVTLLTFPLAAVGPAVVDITWMSMANLYYQIGTVGIVTDGYITRIPQEAFYGGSSGLANTRAPFKPNVDGVQSVLGALGGATRVTLLLTGHSHWDHSFDTGTWSNLTDAKIVGSQTTCYKVMAENVPTDHCTAVVGQEDITIAEDVTMTFVRWNHSGDPTINPEQHNAVELSAVPSRDASTGGLRAGVAEDFPNGGGSRAFLFVVDGPAGRFSWFQQSSASAIDLNDPIIVNGVDYGAPLDNLQNALNASGIDSVDLWIGTGGLPIAERVIPVLKPRAYLPIHWDGLWEPFEPGMPRRFSSPDLEAYLKRSGVELLIPDQFMDKWRLDVEGIRPVDNKAVKEALGFADVQRF